ncbi:CPBP family intramembrane metalloprotease [Facklamia sp. DSM 111018]|uniref:CPBP family intramembrane metalloprotease n=1 Tax=Facklamia lactis TaxID=2749967 RepID=A0ABS0LN61_9LACT|nr:CPBP family intramembrane glutamic endopeptidase [Facklamia lactis]MBG9979725.1 CPBP family intramembrane metalloprotease [Facklamia lactis]MBG9985595.1 CPBP family intramembrane metalloprotease [Facklamia lactis]
MNKVERYLNLVILFSVPFYFLNLLEIEPLFLNLPLSFIAIIVPCLLAGYFIYQEEGIVGVKQWLKSTYQFPTFRLIVVSVIIMPIIFSLAFIFKNECLDLFHSDRLARESGIIFVLFWVGAVIEELGWTAYATKKIQNEDNIFSTGFLIGLYWGLWHLFPYLAQERTLVESLILILTTIGYRIIMGYLYFASNKLTMTGIIFHTMINFVPEVLPGGYDAFHYNHVLILVWLVALLMHYKHGKKEKFL